MVEQHVKRASELKVLNSLGSEKVVFKPMSGDQRVTWYTCGPTVYDDSHLGHARNYINTDIVRRIMRDFMGYEINFCMNVTDIDDKIIKKSQEQGIEFAQLARKYENSFMDDMEKLNVDLPDGIVRVSEYVPEIVAYIDQIIANGYAYESNKSVYFDVDSFKKSHQYLKLEPSNAKNIDKMAELLKEGEGALTSDNTDKRSPFDFALWKT
jgi:cysteinyl-tRNA synthetase